MLLLMLSNKVWIYLWKKGKSYLVNLLTTSLSKNWIVNSLKNYSWIFLTHDTLLLAHSLKCSQSICFFFQVVSISYYFISLMTWSEEHFSTFFSWSIWDQSKGVQEEHSFNSHWRKMHLQWTELYCVSPTIPMLKP